MTFITKMYGPRQSGMTTRLVQKALEFMAKGKKVLYISTTVDQARSFMPWFSNKLLSRMAASSIHAMCGRIYDVILIDNCHLIEKEVYNEIHKHNCTEYYEIWNDTPAHGYELDNVDDIPQELKNPMPFYWSSAGTDIRKFINDLSQMDRVGYGDQILVTTFQLEEELKKFMADAKAVNNAALAKKLVEMLD